MTILSLLISATSSASEKQAGKREEVPLQLCEKTGIENSSDLGHASGIPFLNSSRNQQQFCSGFPAGQQLTVPWTAAEPGHLSEEINSVRNQQPGTPPGERVCITGTQQDRSANKLDSCDSKKNKPPKSKDKQVDQDSLGSYILGTLLYAPNDQVFWSLHTTSSA